jgi:hypothetical protein
MSYPHWEYFLALDADLERAVRFVAPEPANFSAYSIELARLLLGACSEVDVVAKWLCMRVAPSSKRENMDDYRTVITTAYPGFATMKATIPRFGLEFKPWADWETDTNPGWWQSHNKVKHERTQHFPEASLGNSLNAMAGLFVLVLYFYQTALYEHELRPWPSLLDLHADNYKPWGVVGTYKLPDFGTSDDWKKQKKSGNA